MIVDYVRRRLRSWSVHRALAAPLDEAAMLRACSAILSVPEADLAAEWVSFKAFCATEGYGERFGQTKTMSDEEAFVFSVVLTHLTPRSIVEIGTQFGRGTRRLIDMKSRAGSTAAVVTYDVVRHPHHFGAEEATFVERDLTDGFEEEILLGYPPGVIFLDAHPYRLLDRVIRACLRDESWILAVHDCARYLCTRHMNGVDRVHVTSVSGVWERHVLAQVFGVRDPLSLELDCQETPTHRFAVLPTRHGLGLLVPKGLIGTGVSEAAAGAD